MLSSFIDSRLPFALCHVVGERDEGKHGGKCIKNQIKRFLVDLGKMSGILYLDLGGTHVNQIADSSYAFLSLLFLFHLTWSLLDYACAYFQFTTDCVHSVRELDI